MQRLAVLLIALVAAIWLAAPGSGAFAGTGPGMGLATDTASHVAPHKPADTLSGCPTCSGHDMPGMAGICAACVQCAPVLAGPAGGLGVARLLAWVAPPAAAAPPPDHAPGINPPPPRL
ncbi:MAG: hypothetical protein ACWA5A_17710 [Marinibacterium sp.]